MLTNIVMFNYLMSMKVTIEYMGFFKIEDVPSRSELEVEGGTTVTDLLDHLQVKKESRKYMIPLINRQRRGFETALGDGDHLFLYFPVGGG